MLRWVKAPCPALPFLRPVSERVLIINGHPDPGPGRLCAAIAEAYGQGAVGAGRRVRRIDVGALEFPLIRSAGAFEAEEPPPPIAEAQALIHWADHLVMVHPLWHGGPPALLKGFLEQAFRYGFAIPRPEGSGGLGGLLKGRSARIIVTMGMPALAYRAIFGAFGVRAIERSVLWMSGIHPIRRTLLGGVGQADVARCTAWLSAVRAMGARGV